MKKRKLDDFEPEDDHSALSSSNSESENEQDPANQLTSRLSIGYDLKTLPRLRHHDRIFILKGFFYNFFCSFNLIFKI